MALAVVEPWILDALAFYRRLDFFRSPRSDEDVAAWIVRTYNRRYGRYGGGGDSLRSMLYRPRHPQPDLSILLFDRRRLLDLDLESPGVAGDGMYGYELPRLARITRGVFDPLDIEEEAIDDEDGGSVRLAFRVAGRREEHVLWGAHTDWIDMRLVWIVDQQLRGSRYRLYAAPDPVPHQEVIVVALRHDERDLIERERGLGFVRVPDEPPETWWWPNPLN